MKESQFRKLVREELDNCLKEEGEKSSALKNLISKFYMFIIRNDLNKAKEILRNNPELQQMASEIKRESDKIAGELLKDESFIRFLLNKDKGK